jgi:hypothetical protein
MFLAQSVLFYAVMSRVQGVGLEHLLPPAPIRLGLAAAGWGPL